jgi:double-strand break repair protein MRE11
LVATDNHLGYLEKDPIRGEDSFVTFEEILQTALKEQVRIVSL